MRAFDWYPRWCWPWMTLNGIMAAILRYFFTEFGSFGVNFVKVVEVRSNKDVAQRIWLSTIYDLWRYYKRLLRFNALKRSRPTPIESENVDQMLITWKRCEMGHKLVLFSSRKWHRQHRAAISATAQLCCSTANVFYIVLILLLSAVNLYTFPKRTSLTASIVSLV